LFCADAAGSDEADETFVDALHVVPEGFQN
jgi:hypothetical protein